MAILDDLRRDRGLSMLFITHDLELAGAVCDRTCVMYAGQVVETRAADRLHGDPLHPYSAALVRGPTRHHVDGRPARGDPRPAGVGLRGAVGLPLRTALPARAGLAAAAAEQVITELDGGLVRCERAAELRGNLLDGAHV